MIRTRDLIIFVAVLLFLAVGIALTIYSDQSAALSERITTYIDTTITAPKLSAVALQDELNRSSIIARLRNALEEQNTTVEPSPSVVSSTTQTQTEDKEESDSEGSDTLLCSNYSEHNASVRSWPLSGVTFAVEGNYRNVLHTYVPQTGVDINAASTSSSTVPLPTRTLLAIPLAPVPSGSPSCLQDEVIGVTLAGALMFNTEADFYRGYGPDYLIGYARDGFPIYGYYEGELDACGGYMHKDGYRYSISKKGSTVLNCYSATPMQFHP